MAIYTACLSRADFAAGNTTSKNWLSIIWGGDIFGLVLGQLCQDCPRADITATIESI